MLVGKMRTCPRCNSKLAVDFLSTHPNKPGDYLVNCVSYNPIRNEYQQSDCGYWELYENNVVIDKAEED
jgi:predicted nucleic-acid-binding Zn-ribbon protein